MRFHLSGGGEHVTTLDCPCGDLTVWPNVARVPGAGDTISLVRHGLHDDRQPVEACTGDPHAVASRACRGGEHWLCGGYGSPFAACSCACACPTRCHDPGVHAPPVDPGSPMLRWYLTTAAALLHGHRTPVR